MNPADVQVAKLAAECGVLEQRRDELKASLARAMRDRGALYGLVAGALKDGALSGVYVDLANRVIGEVDVSRVADPLPFGRGH